MSSEERGSAVLVPLKWRSLCAISAGHKAGPLPPWCLENTVRAPLSLADVSCPFLSLGRGWAGAGVGLCFLWEHRWESRQRICVSVAALLWRRKPPKTHTPKPLSSLFTHLVGNVSMVSVNTIPVHSNLHVAFAVSPIINYVLQGAVTIAEILEMRRVTLLEVPKGLIKIKS